MTLLRTNCNTQYFDTTNSCSCKELSDCITKRMLKKNIRNMTPIILCIGTDRATGDCLGPLVGEQLLNYNSRYTVMGCLSAPVHALNLGETITRIYKSYDNPYVIAVDAALGISAHIGYITVSDCPIEPGKGVNKKLPVIGDISITGIVNLSGKSPALLQNTRLYTVMNLANCIAASLKNTIDYLEDFVPL